MESRVSTLPAGHITQVLKGCILYNLELYQTGWNGGTFFFLSTKTNNITLRSA